MMLGWMDAWMRGCVDAWMRGCVDAWMRGCVDAGCGVRGAGMGSCVCVVLEFVSLLGGNLAGHAEVGRRLTSELQAALGWR